MSLRVCLLSKQFHPTGGGSERYAHVLANALGRRGHSVDVFALGDTEGLQEFSLHDNVVVTFLARRQRPLVTFETLYYSLVTRTTINFEKYDVIHGTLMPASPVALTLRPPETPIVVTSHGTSIGEVHSHKLEVPTDYLKKFFFHPMNVLMDAITAPRAARIISISSIAHKELEQYYPISSEDIVRIPHGVDADYFTSDAPQHTAVDPDRFTLLHVGRLVSRKHADLALEGLAVADRDDVELLLAGTGHHRERLEARTDELGLTEQVEFLGFVPDGALPSLYASSDAFLFLSRYEGFGLTFLEAMASGTPVIGTPVGGFPDVVSNGEDSLIVDHDGTDVARAIDELTDHPDRTNEMGIRARRVAKGRTWDDVATDTEVVYRSVINEE